jgi:hypothetical protein
VEKNTIKIGVKKFAVFREATSQKNNEGMDVGFRESWNLTLVAGDLSDSQ